MTIENVLDLIDDQDKCRVNFGEDDFLVAKAARLRTALAFNVLKGECHGIESDCGLIVLWAY